VNPPGKRNWRLVALGVSATAALVGYAVARPWRARSPSDRLGVVADAVHLAVLRRDPGELHRASELLRRGTHRDLLGREVPALLRLLTALEQAGPRCVPSRDAAALELGACLLWQGRFEEAVIVLSRVPSAEGGTVYREVTARLLREYPGRPARSADRRSERP
jgi:hypothetical protein